MKPSAPPANLQSQSLPAGSATIQLTSEAAAETCHKVVSMVCQRVGFDAIKRPALEALSDTVGLYLEKMFAATDAYAELANRLKPTCFDLERALEDMGVRGSDLEQYMQTLKRDGLSMSNQTTIEPPHDFLPSDDENEEDAGADDQRSMDGYRSSKPVPHPDYVPPHLPAFPSKHTFKQTPVFVSRTDDPQRLRELNMQQSRLVEENLKRLMTAENELLSRGAVASLCSSGSAMVDPILGGIMPVVNYESQAQRKNQLRLKLKLGSGIALKSVVGGTAAGGGGTGSNGQSQDGGVSWSQGTAEEGAEEEIVVHAAEKKRRKLDARDRMTV